MKDKNEHTFIVGKSKCKCGEVDFVYKNKSIEDVMSEISRKLKEIGVIHSKYPTLEAEIFSLVQQSKEEERERIEKLLPEPRKKIGGEYKDRRANGFNECLNLVKKLHTLK